jgi:hypothetical protein
MDSDDDGILMASIEPNKLLSSRETHDHKFRRVAPAGY